MPPELPKEPPALTKTELKAQKKKDRLYLNLLKQRIQPIMDQIKLKHKKFRTGVIDESQIRYLFDEEDPTIVSTDLPLEERRMDPSRLYERATNDHGEPGLVHKATGKFFYNMEIVTIEKRLSNGYYKRPKDFAADIKKLVKDAKMIDDPERIIKANELLTNVEVDTDNIGVEMPWLVAELENVYARELKREKEMVEKAKQAAAAEGRRIDTIPSNVPPADIGASMTEQSTGPIVLGEPITNGLVQHPITPSNASQPSTLTNGFSGGLSDLSDLHGHQQSNGTSVPSRNEEDVHMSKSDDGPSTQKETQDSSIGPSAQTRPNTFPGGPHSIDQRRSIPGSLSQHSFMTPVAAGSDIRDYTNYASTTSSEKRNTGPSSGEKNTQSTAGGNPDGPDLGVFGTAMGPDSQLPDTAGNTQGKPTVGHLFSNVLAHTKAASQSSTRPNSNPSNPSSSQGQLSQQERLSQTPAVPQFPRDGTTINSLLNDPAPDQSRALTSHRPQLVVDHAYTSNFLETIVSQTSGCSVEQLEQIYSALMSEIWKTRDDWDRGKVGRKVGEVFEETMEDIQSCQGMAAGSWEIEE